MRLSSLLLALALAGRAALAQMAVVNAASFTPGGPVASGSFAAVFGENLCSQTANPGWIAPGQLPTEVAGCAVTVNGTAAMLQYVSPGQINFIVPPNMGPGKAAVSVTNGSQSFTGSLEIAPAAPGIFARNGMGMGQGAMANGMTWTTGPFSVGTNGQPTVLAMYVTGLDLTSAPTVSVAGMPAMVAWYGAAPGLAGLQQVNIMLPAGMAGAGRVPVTVTSAGQTSNATFMTVLPTTAMMQGMPGWGAGMTMAENMPRGHEASDMAFNPAANTALVTDENDDVVRVVSLDTGTTTATITLPAGSQAHAIAVDGTGKLAAVALSARAAVAILDLSQNKVLSIVGTGYYPSHVAFAGGALLATSGASGTLSVIDTASGTLSRTVNVGFGAAGIATNGAVAVVANMQAAALSVIRLADDSVSTIALPAGARAHDVAISGNKAIATMPMSNGIAILDLASNAVAAIDTGASNAMGPGGVVADARCAYAADMMTATVTVVDLATAKVLKTISVDPGPRALALNPARNQLLVLSEGTGTLDVVDLGGGAIVSRLNAADTERQGNWSMPLIASMSPDSAAAGTSFTLTVAGTDLAAVRGVEFDLAAGSGGGGMMGGGMMGGGADAAIQVSNVQVNPAGTTVTATVRILANAAPGTRQVRLQTNGPTVMAPMWSARFTVTR